MNPVARVLLGAGLVLIAAGVLWQLLGRHLPLGRLPGDIVVEKENVRFYFPIVTCLVVSLLATLLLAILRFFK